MRIALVSALMISLMGIPAPAVAATGGGAIAASFNICAMFPQLPWCPR
ncbi:MAG: hypothetical protein ACOH16_01890 [Propionibacteriaceae bacterium]